MIEGYSKPKEHYAVCFVKVYKSSYAQQYGRILYLSAENRD